MQINLIDFVSYDCLNEPEHIWFFKTHLEVCVLVHLYMLSSRAFKWFLNLKL